MRIAVLLVVSVASPAVAAPCPGTRVEVTSPTAADRRAGNVATLRGSFRSNEGYGADSEWVCIASREGERSVRGSFSVELAASKTELQRITIGGGPILIHLPPGGDLHIAPHPCVFWEMFAAWLDGPGIDPPRSIAVDNKRACPTGYIEGGHIVEAARQDEAQHSRRCVRSARLALDASARRTLKLVDHDETLPPGSTIDWSPYGGICPQFTTIDTGGEQIRIAPGVGERWRLTIDATGKLRGSL